MTHRHRAHVSPSTAILWLTAVLVLTVASTLHQDRGLWAQSPEFTSSDPGYLTGYGAPETRLVVASSPSQSASSGDRAQRNAPWWPWILAFPVLGGGLWWWLLRGTAPAPLTADKEKPATAPETAGSGAHREMAAMADSTAMPSAAVLPEATADLEVEPAVESTVAHQRRIILTSRSSQAAYAYWELPPSEVEALKRNNYGLSLKLHDVTDIAQVDQQPPHTTQYWNCTTAAVGDCHLPIVQADRDYLVELGYGDESSTWHALVRSAPVRVPAMPNSEGVSSSALDESLITSAVRLETMPSASRSLGLRPETEITTPAGRTVDRNADIEGHPEAQNSEAKNPEAKNSVASASIPRLRGAAASVTLTAQTCRSAYAAWELPPDQVNDLRVGQRRLMVRLYDVTELPGSFALGPNSVQEFEADLAPQSSLTLPIAIDDRDYLIEVGYLTGNGQWQILAKSSPVRVPTC